MNTPQLQQLENEKKIVNLIEANFNPETSRAKNVLKEFFHGKFTQKDAFNLAEVLADQLNLQLGREAQRREIVLMYWYEQNLDLILPNLSKISFEYET
jgi:hypothetical protein